MTIEKVGINPCDVINKSLPRDPKCMNLNSDYVPLIPPPKAKRTPKPKADKPPKEAKPKPKGGKAQQNIEAVLNTTN